MRSLYSFTLLFALTSGGALAQEQNALPQDIERDVLVLRERGRERLHPSDDPLDIVGREEGDNTLRAGTPTLARATRAEARVGADEAYARRRALYEQGATFSAPLPQRALERSTATASSDDEGPEPDGGPPWVPIGVVAAACVAAFCALRQR